MLVYIYIYIYIYVYIYIFIYTYLIEHYRHYDIWRKYYRHDIRRQLVDKPSVISHFPSTFRPALSHHQERMYYKSDVTFVGTLRLCKNERLYWSVYLSVYLFLKIALEAKDI